MTNKVYEVLECSGEYEDYCETTIFTTKDKIKGEEYCKKYNEINNAIANIKKDTGGFNNYFYDDSYAEVKELTIIDNINSPRPLFKFEIYIGDDYVEYDNNDIMAWTCFEWSVNIDTNPSIFETIVEIDDKNLTLTISGHILYDIKSTLVEEISKLNNKDMLEFYLGKISKVYIELEKVERCVS